MVNLQSQSETARQADPPSGKAGRDKPLVLVVNDTQEILELFREILEDEGFDVILSSFGIQEVAEVQEIDPDLIILDFLIGGEALGWQMLQKLRMTRETEKLPVVVCTAALQLVKELEGHLTSKNVGLVLKPFDIDDLLRAVHTAMQPGGIAGVRDAGARVGT